MSIRVCDLGPITVEVQGRLVTVAPRPEAVLAALLVQVNQRVTVDALIEAVWSDSSTDGSRSTLESHIWRLRQVLEPGRARGASSEVLVNDAGGYRLVLRAQQADSLLLTHLDDQVGALLPTDPQRAVRRCDEALALWRGAPFGAAADAPWAAAEVARLREIRDRLRIRRIDGLLVSDVQRAVIDSDVLVRELPLREDVWARRMLALHRAGRPEEALRAFAAARGVLLEELGIEPGVELQDLHRRVLEQDPHLRAPAPEGKAGARVEVHLPRRLSVLIGRSAELSALSTLIERRHLVTVVGPAGCGKTRLAIEVARHAADRFPDGVWLIDLAAIERPELVGDLVGSTIGLSPGVTGAVAAQLQEFTRDRRMLLLFDNCEHLAAAMYDLLGELLGDDSALHVLLTSREPISVPGEVTWPLRPLPVPAEVGPEASAALELFLARVRDADPTAELTPADLTVASAVCDAVDGLPLALELAAARTRTTSLAEIAAQVRTDLGGLSRIGVRGDHRRTIRDAIEGSHRLLGRDEQILHRRLAVLAGSFTRDCAAAVAGFDPLQPDDVPDLLDQLAHRSMISPIRAVSPDTESTFRQLATVRSHATAALAAAGETAIAVRSRHRWLRTTVEQRPRVGRADDRGWYAGLDRDFGTVRACLQSILIDDPDPLGGWVLSRISNYWYNRGRMVEALRWLDAAVPAPAGTDPVDEAMTELSLAGLHGMRGRFDLARPLLDRALHTLDRFEVLPVDRHADVVEHLASLALVGALHQDFAMVGDLGRRLHALAVGGPADFTVMADAVSCFAGIRSTPPAASAERAGAIYRRADEIGALLAAWICCIVRTSLAVPLGDPADGLVWSERLIDIQTRLGVQLESMPIEGRAALTAATGDHRRGVALFAASHAQSRRAGIGWPTRPATRAQLEQARLALGSAAFEQAWSDGLTLSPAEAFGRH